MSCSAWSAKLRLAQKGNSENFWHLDQMWNSWRSWGCWSWSWAFLEVGRLARSSKLQRQPTANQWQRILKLVCRVFPKVSSFYLQFYKVPFVLNATPKLALLGVGFEMLKWISKIAQSFILDGPCCKDQLHIRPSPQQQATTNAAFDSSWQPCKLSQNRNVRYQIWDLKPILILNNVAQAFCIFIIGRRTFKRVR